MEEKRKATSAMQVQLFMQISEILAGQGLINEDEKNRLKILISNEYRE